ncbi:uncharacterized protein BDR25DRAFT_315729 [Lindgomyces ingoldianus]|uniref:Uncharacterized protein n=1 Tax=Lindgomyces ingoldianus TaxID=673940 RepID=A0ACB6QP11_9PLEO|nr:uncharacterized protein BDR25DRAFT_315729 [Lindgomyces ingoldianus]KAF2468749.1 hypothetical protein BDR25DRAFT_315729 [Lindgomyces ingoldianus]
MSALRQQTGFPSPPTSTPHPPPINEGLPPHIHPILAHQNWIQFHGDCRECRGSCSLWRDLQPSIQLASELLTHPRSLTWFIRVLHGEEILDPVTGHLYLLPSELEREPRALAWVVEAVRKYLIDFAPHIKISFGELGKEIHGQMRPWPNKGFITINATYAEYFLSGQRSPIQDLRTSWAVAVVLVHEIAHAVAFLARGSGKEALYDRAGDENDDLGWALERRIFGVRIDWEIDAIRGATGMWVRKLEDRKGMGREDLVPLWWLGWTVGFEDSV